MDLTQKAKAIKQNKTKQKWDMYQNKNLLHSKGNINKVKRQCTEWENIFANDVANRGLIKQLNIKKKNKNNK